VRVVDAPHASEALRDTPGVEELLGRAQRATVDRLATVKDLAYLSWRYGCAEPDYRAVARRDSNGALGLAIFRVYERRGLRIASVCELLIGPDDLTLGRRLLRDVAHASGADLLTCHFARHSTQRRAALRAGFVRTHRQLLPAMRRVSSDISPDPTLSDSWAMCLGDFDML
jgi:hypothetical protein